MTTKRYVDLLKTIAEEVRNCKSFESTSSKLRFISASDGKLTAEFKVAEEHLNQQGGLHGGFTATLVDNITGYALLTQSEIPGVTVNLHVSYLKGTRKGDDVIVDAQTIRRGKTLAYLTCELRHKSDNSTIAVGTHTLYVGQQAK